MRSSSPRITPRSRTALTRLTPPDQTGAFFGVYALSGVATAWLAPGLVALVTGATGSQKLGFAAIIVLLAIGLVGLFFVRGARADDGVGSARKPA